MCAPNHKKLKDIWIAEDHENWDYSIDEPARELIYLQLMAPNLMSLRLDNVLCRRYMITNMRNLVSACFDFEQVMQFDDLAIDGYAQLVELLEAVSHVKNLKLCSWCVQVLSKSELGCEKPLLLSATHLELKLSGFNNCQLLGMSYLLKSSHHLTHLVVNINEKIVFSEDMSNLSSKESNEKEYWKSLELNMSNLLQQLKTIKIYGFMGSKRLSGKEKNAIVVDEFIDRRLNEVLLVKCFLKNCNALEKMTISTTKKHIFCPECKMKSELLLTQVQLNLSRRLLLIPKASPVEIIFI